MSYVLGFLGDCALVTWLSLPLLLANMLPVVLGGGRPMDFGWCAGDGRRLLGDGKTWQGFFGGVFFGVLTTWTLAMLALTPGGMPSLYRIWEIDDFQFIRHMGWLALGALLGDLTKSLIKRRIGFDRGQPWFLVDQFDAVAGAFLLSWMFDRQWFTGNFIASRGPALMFMLLVYLVGHQILSRWAHANHLKLVPH
ncbi:MAG: CDP-archaeol synthase [Candidatus Kerfeldbacteria bacterium]|nr:CDP-archaeol synthase [Candidatus Kerfeldbacteria bacterium]